MRIAAGAMSFGSRRFVAPIAVLVMIAGAGATYQFKHDAAEAADHVAELRHEIVQERIAISLLKAEWSELTQPGRLQVLIERNQNILPLAAFGIDQMVRIRDLPEPPTDDADLIANILTGAVR